MIDDWIGLDVLHFFKWNLDKKIKQDCVLEHVGPFIKPFVWTSVVSWYLPSPSRAYHHLGRRVLAVKVRKCLWFFFLFVCFFLNDCPSCPHNCQLVTWSSSFAIVNMQVIPLDITVELQKQIMSELEILYKVSGHLGSVSTLFTGCFNHIYYVFN